MLVELVLVTLLLLAATVSLGVLANKWYMAEGFSLKGGLCAALSVVLSFGFGFFLTLTYRLHYLETFHHAG